MHLPVYVALGLSFALNVSGGFFAFDFSFFSRQFISLFIIWIPSLLPFWNFPLNKSSRRHFYFVFKRFIFMAILFLFFFLMKMKTKIYFISTLVFFCLRGVHSFPRGAFLSRDFVIYVRTCFLSAESILKHGKACVGFHFVHSKFFLYILYNSIWWMAGSPPQEALVT